MRALGLTFVVVAAWSCRPPPVTALEEGPVRVAPTRVDFGRVFIGYPSTRVVEVTNPNRFAIRTTAAGDGPFAVEPSLDHLEASGAASLSVVFSPTSVGPASGRFTLNDTTVEFEGEGAAVPACDAGAPCLLSTFDPLLGGCVVAPLADGLDCTASASCFLKASCQQGECVGTLTTCADQNPCTLDVCGSSGCGHLDGLPSCPEPGDPCLVPICDPRTGCGQAPAVDGTTCGPRTCTQANVCINGQCVLRSAPQNQACADVVIGVPAGQGSSDGPPSLARFRSPGAAAWDDRGNLYVLDRCAVRKVTPSGQVKTIAGVVDACAHVDGTGLAARFTYPTAMVFDGTSLVVREDCMLRKVSLSGVVSPWVGSHLCGKGDGIGRAARLGFGPIAMEPGNRRLLLFDREAYSHDVMDGGFWLREVSRSTGEVTTLGPVSMRPLTPPSNHADLMDTLTVSADGGIFTCLIETQYIGSASVGGGGFLVQFDRAGQSHTVSVGECLHVAATPDGVLVDTWAELDLVTATGRAPFAGSTSGFADGPAAAARFGGALALAAGDAGVAVVDGQNANVRLVRAGMVSTLTGAQPDRRVVDGPVAGARLEWPTALQPWTDGGVVFFDGSLLRLLDSAGQVSTVVGSSTGVQGAVDGPFLRARFGSPSTLVLRGSGLWIAEAHTRPDFTSWVLLRQVDFASQQVTTLGEYPGLGQPQLATSAAGWVGLLMDYRIWDVTNLTPLLALTPPWSPSLTTLSPASPDGWYAADSWRLLRQGDGGVVSFVAGSSSLVGPRDGPVATAAFSDIRALALDPSGDLYLADLNRVRRYSPSLGTVSTVFELSDAPFALALEPGGTLLVMVPSAILRLRP